MWYRGGPGDPGLPDDKSRLHPGPHPRAGRSLPEQRHVTFITISFAIIDKSHNVFAQTNIVFLIFFC